MSLEECWRKHTFRQYRAWIAWLDEEWNRPDRSDFYLMQIAAEVRKVLASKGSRKKIKVENFWIPRAFWEKLFKGKQTKDPSQEVVSPTRAAMSKAFWFSLVGIGRKNDEK